MAIYPPPPPHARLDVFFADMFKEMRKAPPEAYGAFLMRAEEEFRRTGYRDKAEGVENILIVRLDAIGDMILTSGFIREVRKNFPAARITLIVTPGVYPIVELCPYVNEVLTLEKNALFGNIAETLEKIAVFCRDNLWQKNFSVAFSPRWFSDTLIELLIVWLSGARERIGYGTNPFKSWLGDPPPDEAAQDNFFLTKNIVTPQNVISDADKNFYLLAAAGLKINETHIELWYGAEDFRRAKEWIEKLPTDSKKIILGIGASAPTKKYPVDKYLIALRELAKRNISFIIVGGKSELDEAAYLESNLPSDKVLNLAGKTTLRETEATAAQADFYIGNDTGVLHMAAAAHVPVIGIYRGSVEMENVLPAINNEFRRFPPYGTQAMILRPQSPLGECATLPPVFGGCHHINEPHCITQIQPQAIIEAFDKLELMIS